ncbi:hypothetical protein [Ectobacillus panaciterrae]|uniref:hypothetical protein n=1 Tax=Ectobacillus panaciterrae TaxID=363872 RepID=UPI0004143EB5|nr:hypothetical protein [Ectobacillus panaciterrae]
MKWLIYMYPKKWRARYEEEFLLILEERRFSLKDFVDIFVNAIDTRLLNLVEDVIVMNNKLRDVMLQSIFMRFLIISSVIALGAGGGFWIASGTPAIEELSPKMVLLIGIGLGAFVGYVLGVARGILRVVNVAQKEDIFFPTGTLKFDKEN